jgi:hypothetical protein
MSAYAEMAVRVSIAVASAVQHSGGQQDWRGAIGGGLIGGVLLLALVGALSIGHPTRTTPMRDDPRGWANVRARPYVLGLAVICFVIAAIGAGVHWL